MKDSASLLIGLGLTNIENPLDTMEAACIGCPCSFIGRRDKEETARGCLGLVILAGFTVIALAAAK
mgnify:CR=1 FL=1